MCGRFAIAQSRFTHIEQSLHTTFAEVLPRYNIAPTQQIPVIRRIEDGNYVMSDMKWGWVPSWSKTPTTTYNTFNARIETVAEKPLFRSAFQHRRCLIPASGFFEWHTEEHRKQPYYFTFANNQEMGLAGIWDVWKKPDGTLLESCAIIVGRSNSLIGRVHDRMATIIPESHYDDWLNPNEKQDYLLAILTLPYPAEKMRAWRVSVNVNSVRNQGSELIQPLARG